MNLRSAVLAVLLAFPALASAAPNLFRIPPDAPGGFATYFRPMPTYTDARVLAANVAEDHTVPGTARFVIFSATCAAFYAKAGGTAAVPAGDVTDGTGSTLNPGGFFVGDIVTIGLIAPATCVVTMDFYK